MLQPLPTLLPSSRPEDLGAGDRHQARSPDSGMARSGHPCCWAECAPATHQVDEVRSDRAVGDADGDALRGTDVFGRVLHPQEVHPLACRRKSQMALRGIHQSQHNGLTRNITTERVVLQGGASQVGVSKPKLSREHLLTSGNHQANGRWPGSLHEVPEEGSEQMLCRFQLLQARNPE